MSKLSAETQEKIRALRDRYPERRSAVMAALHYAQADAGYLDEETLVLVADLLELPPNTTTEVVGFYTMFDQVPRGRYKIEVCRNLSCALMGAQKMVDHLKNTLGIQVGETTPDGKFTLLEAECLGACGYAPMLQIGPYYFENLSRADVDAILDALRRDEMPPIAPAGYFEKDGAVPERGRDGRAIPTASEAIMMHLAVPPAPRQAAAETAPAGTKEEGQ